MMILKKAMTAAALVGSYLFAVVTGFIAAIGLLFLNAALADWLPNVNEYDRLAAATITVVLLWAAVVALIEKALSRRGL